MSGKTFLSAAAGVFVAALLAFPVFHAGLSNSHSPDDTRIVRLLRSNATGDKWVPHCSGTLLSDGRVLTAAHCTHAAGGLQVLYSDGTTATPVLSWANAEADLAVYLVDRKRPDVRYNCTEPRVGDWIVTAGFPAYFDRSTFWGRVATLATQIGEPGRLDRDGTPAWWVRRAYAADIMGMGGQSGSSVWDMRGRLTGVLVGGIDSDHYTFIVPGATVCSLLQSGGK